MNLTKTQNDVVTARARDMIVSAGAGSGKTTVLTKRLIERIKAGDSVTDFLVVTFMNSAASDIKRKLYEALIAESAVSPDDRHLYRQTLLIPEAYICTISAYCLSLVRENFARLGISPKVRVIDETEKTMMLTRTADGLVSELYNSGEDWFLRLAGNFSGDKGDDPLIEKMISLYDKLRVMLDYDKLLSGCAEMLNADAEITDKNGFFESDTGKAIKKRLTSRLDEVLESATELYDFAVVNAETDKYLAPIAEFCDRVGALRDSVDAGYLYFRETIKSTLSGIPALLSKGCNESAHEYIKQTKADITKALRDIKARYCRGSDDFVADSFRESADLVESIKKFILLLDKRYKSLKKESAMLDYGDFERYALELLETRDSDGTPQPTELCLRKRKCFKEVLIDEYQDVNPMQDRLFGLLSGEGSRFMVGDVKQSIYRFRNAYPDIFLGYKEIYPDYKPGENNARILLRENFRCSQCVIDYVNHLFDSVTKDLRYRAEYEDEWLIHASDKPELNHPVVVAVADREPKKAKEATRDEAEFIAREINRLVREEMSDDGNPLSYGDIAVMLSAMKGYSIEYERAFRKYGVPYKSESSENFMDNPVVSLAVSAMRAVDDPTDDISLCALMRSPICNFSSGELYIIRLRLRDTAFWNAVTTVSRPSRSNIKNHTYTAKKRKGAPGLCAKCRAFVRRIADWRHASLGVPCGEFLKSFFVSTGLLRIASAEGNKKSLMLLYEYARRYESSSYLGLSGFLDYLKELEAGGRTMTDVASAGDADSVSFITVHKSKGLEYKVCFIAGVEKKFKFTNTKDGMTLLRRRGVFFRLRDRAKMTVYDPFCDILAQDIERENVLGEELRKLYVALTRAKERLYITGTSAEGWRERRVAPIRAQSWLDWVLYTASLGEKLFFDVRSISKSDGDPGFIPQKSRPLVEPTKSMLDAVRFEYPYPNAVTTAGKISVSELREGLLEDDEYDRSKLSVPTSRVSYKPSFATEYTATPADIGTANHVFMQFCDFNNIDLNGVGKESVRLLEIGMITDEQFDMLDPSALTRFFQSRLYAEMRSSKRLYREKRFSVRDKLSENGETILVQGVIDCFFENPDGTYTVVDYKTDRVKTERDLAERHRVQLECYCRAVESMTGHKVSRALLYSFALGREIEL